MIVIVIDLHDIKIQKIIKKEAEIGIFSICFLLFLIFFRNTSRSNYISTHHRSRKIYNRQVTKSSSRDYKKNHFSSSSDSSTDVF